MTEDELHKFSIRCSADEQNMILKEQSKLINEQKDFNKGLTLATSILAFGIIYGIFIKEFILYSNNKIFEVIGLILLSFFIITIFIFIIQFLITFRRKNTNSLR